MHTTFFIVGAVRSGTTMLRLMLGRHSAICACDELESVTPHLVGRADWPAMDQVAAALELDRIWQASPYQLRTDLDFPGAMRDVPEQRRRLDGKPIFGAVVHNHFGELPRLWPDAKYIYLNRDPRDVARSCVKAAFAGGLVGGSMIWLDSREELQHLQAAVPAGNLMSLCFEDLVADPETHLRAICAHLDVDYEPGMLQIDENTTYQPPDPKLAKNWRTSASPGELETMECTMGGEAIRAAGYEPQTDAVRWSDRELRRRRRREKVQQHITGMKHYGPMIWWLTTAGRKSKWFAGTALHKRAVRRKNRISETFLK